MGMPLFPSASREVKRMRKTILRLVTASSAALLASAVVLATVFGSARSIAAAAERPNIVFVLTDDQHSGTLSAMPDLQNDLVSQGIQFTNMTSTFPLCCPGRATILRGQYPHNTRIYGNSLPKGGWEKFRNRGEHNSNFATWLNDAGYRTGLFGKYMNDYTDPDIPPGWDRWYAWNGLKQGWTALNDQGIQKPLDPRSADSQTSDAALKFLGNNLGRPAPVFAFVNFGAEHEPFLYDQVNAEKFQGAGVPRVPSFNEDDVSDKPSYVGDTPQLSDAEVAQMDQDYASGLRSLMRVDSFIARASDLLRSKGEMRNTYFVFYTDNGAHFGHHRLAHGKLQPYEEDTGFPLIVRGPGIPRGETRTQLVGNHDIAPTLGQMGGARIPAFVDGRSFLPIAQDPTIAWSRTAILSERKTNTLLTQRWDMLRMREEVYTSYESGEKEFYDLAADPYQLHNALDADETAYPPPDSATLAYYERRLDTLYACSGHEGPGSCREAENAPSLPASTAR
jgi:arylsulfatase A-like enzyme